MTMKKTAQSYNLQSDREAMRVHEPNEALMQRGNFEELKPRSMSHLSCYWVGEQIRKPRRRHCWIMMPQAASGNW